MQPFDLYLFNLLAIALPLALFEIVIEGKCGWGSGWDKSKWYARPFASGSALARFIANALRIEPLLNYHALLFGVIVPASFVLEYFFLTSNVLALVASFVAVLAIEDFLWFALNWHFASFRELLKGPNGAIWWHKRWVRISKNCYLPASYFSTVPVSVILLLLSYL